MHKHHEYPKFLYHKEKDPIVVKDAEEHKALGSGWKDSPAHFQDKKEDGKKGSKASPEVVEEPAVIEEPIEIDEEPALEEPAVEEESEESEGFFAKGKKGKKGKK